MRFAAPIAQMLEVARSQLGYVEKPVNRTKYGQWFGWDGVAWCAIWVSWVFAHAGSLMPKLSNSKGAAYCPTIATHAQQTGQWRGPGYNPKPGDLVLFKFTNRIDHIGMVGPKARMADGRVHTYEGNTNAAGSRTGGMVAELYRRSGIAGFVVVDDVSVKPPPYVPPPSVPPPPAPPAQIEEIMIYLRDPKTETIFCFGANTYQRFTWEQWQRRLKEGVSAPDDATGGAIIFALAVSRADVSAQVPA